MPGVAKMLRSVFIFRGIATADVSAFQAQSQMDPRVPQFDAVLADVFLGTGNLDLVEMRTFSSHCDSPLARSYRFRQWSFESRTIPLTEAGSGFIGALTNIE